MTWRRWWVLQFAAMELMLRIGSDDAGVRLYMRRDVAERLRDTLTAALAERPDTPSTDTTPGGDR